MKNSKKELAVGKLCSVITVTEEWKSAYMKICIFIFFPCTMILPCLVNWSCCKCSDTLCLSFGYNYLNFFALLIYLLIYLLVCWCLCSCGSSGRTADKTGIGFKADQVKVKQEPGTEEEICSFSGTVKQEKTEDGRRSACMVKLVCAQCVVLFLAACLTIWKGKKKKKAFFTLKLHSWRYFLPGNALPGTGWPVIEILSLRWSVIQCICCF